MSGTGYIFECRNLSKKYGDIQALDDVNLSILPGRIIGILGPNGSPIGAGIPIAGEEFRLLVRLMQMYICR